jgi:hypothetical protein
VILPCPLPILATSVIGLEDYALVGVSRLHSLLAACANLGARVWLSVQDSWFLL